MSSTQENAYKVRLIPISSLVNGEDPSAIRASQVVFDVTPTFTESGGVEYTPVMPVHMPGAMQVYKNTSSRQFDISAHFISRNVADALKNMKYVQRLRGWRYPYFGGTDTLTDANNQARREAEQRRANQAGTATSTLTDSERASAVKDRVQSEGVQLRGAPPDVLYLYAYSNSQIDVRNNTGSVFTPTNINRIPVVVTSLTINYPEDVDYIPVYDLAKGAPDAVFTQPWPVKIDVSITLAETHSPREFERFDLNAYKNGNLANF